MWSVRGLVTSCAALVLCCAAIVTSGCSGTSHPTPTVVGNSAQLGDGFCQSGLASGGYVITPATGAPQHRIEEAIGAANYGPLSGYAHLSAYFANVVNPYSGNMNLGPPTEARPTWVVEGTEPRPISTREFGPPTQPLADRLYMVGFVDDQTFQNAGAWGAC